MTTTVQAWKGTDEQYFFPWTGGQLDNVRIFRAYNSRQPRLICHPRAEPAFSGLWNIVIKNENSSLNMNLCPIMCVRQNSQHLFFTEFIQAHNAIQVANQSRDFTIPVVIVTINNRAIESAAWRYMLMMSVRYVHSSKNATLSMVYQTIEQEMPEPVQHQIFGEKLSKTVFSKFLGVTLKRIDHQSSEYNIGKGLRLKKFSEIAAIARSVS